MRGRLDYLIGLELHRGPHELDPKVLEVLRLGAYQLFYMESVPVYAAVSEAVDQVRAVAGPGPTGLVNAVLRKLDRARDGLERFPSEEDDPLGFLETWGSHPRWLLERWLGRWTAADVGALVERDNRRPSHYLVPLGIDVHEASRRLSQRGLASEPVGAGTLCLRLGEGVTPSAAIEALPQALIQDPAAHLVVLYGDVPKGTKVADLCAAPGSKAIAVADRADSIWAADRSEARLRMVIENARRTGRRMGFAVADACRPPFRGIDVVLLDVPCSGTGTLRRHPDARWKLRAATLGDLVELQREMLDAAARLLAPGGILLYSTCSLESEENEEQVAAFLERHRDFEIEARDSVPARYTDDVGCLVIRPQDTGFDGAFAARLRRAA